MTHGGRLSENAENVNWSFTHNSTIHSPTNSWSQLPSSSSITFDEARLREAATTHKTNKLNFMTILLILTIAVDSSQDANRGHTKWNVDNPPEYAWGLVWVIEISLDFYLINAS